MEHSAVELLEASLRAMGLSPLPQAVDGMVQHLDLLVDWSQRVNLTALKEERDLVLKHAVDSAMLAPLLRLQRGSRLLDVGTGAGFPGVPVKCLFPEINLVLLESLAKRCRFLEAVRDRLTPTWDGAGSLEIVWGRAEDMGQKEAFRESFDVVTARAVAELRVLSELCLPFCRVGGHFIAMKGPGAADELAACGPALEILGGKVSEVVERELPSGAGSRTFVRIEKVRRSPKLYPRRAGTPEKSPL